MIARDAEALLRRVTLRDLVTREIRTGIYWSALLCIDGAAALRVTQDGRGGCNVYDPPSGTDYAAAGRVRADLDAACEALGLGAFEPLSTLTAGMVDGDCAFDTLPATRAYLAEMSA